MRSMTARAAALLAALLMLSCAASKPISVSGPGGADSFAVADSAASMADEVFVERHASALAELASREAETPADTRLIEVRSLISAAEETYLRGRTLIALEILDHAESILRRNE